MINSYIIIRYSGINCDQPVCTGGCGISAQGTCVAPESCRCKAGWSGHNCTSIQCDVPCYNGACRTINVCTCDNGNYTDKHSPFGSLFRFMIIGWSGTACHKPICSLACVNGKCTAPNTCTCINDGWSGATCSTPVCPGGCDHGTCTSAYTCTCQSVIHHSSSHLYC